MAAVPVGREGVGNICAHVGLGREAAGVSGVTLREWTRRGILPVPIESVRGRGNVTKYPRSAVARAELARRLRDEGWTLDAIAEHMQARTTADEADPTKE